MQEVVDLLSDEYGWATAFPTCPAKLQRGASIQEVLELADVLGYDIVWQQRRRSDAPATALASPVPMSHRSAAWMAVKDAANVCKKRSAEQLHADGLTMGKVQIFFRRGQQRSLQ